MTLIATFKWTDGKRYMIGDTLLSFDSGGKVHEQCKLLQTSFQTFGFAGDASVSDWWYDRITDLWGPLPPRTLAREAHEYLLEKYGSTDKYDKLPDGDMLCASGEGVHLVLSSGSSHHLQGDFHAIGSGEAFARGYWHSRLRFTSAHVFAQAMVNACSKVDSSVGGPITIVEV